VRRDRRGAMSETIAVIRHPSGEGVACDSHRHDREPSSLFIAISRYDSTVGIVAPRTFGHNGTRPLYQDRSNSLLMFQSTGKRPSAVRSTET
jgi:hypothetical protein